MRGSGGTVRNRGTEAKPSWSLYYDAPRVVAWKRNKQTEGGFPTRKAAQARLNVILADIARGEHVDKSKLTVGAYLTEQWLPTLTTKKLKGTTQANYDLIVRQYLNPRIGHKGLQALTAGDLDACYADLLKDGRQHGRRADNKGLSPRTVRMAHVTMHAALKAAVRKKLVVTNVADYADPPSAKAAREDAEQARNSWTGEEWQTFLKESADHRLIGAFALLGGTGLRRGEGVALRWRDVNLGDRPSVSVERTLVVVGSTVQLSTPKTRQSRRRVPLDAATAAAMRRHRTRQLEERLARGLGKPGPDSLIFTREDGEALHPAVFSQIFADLVAKAGVRKIRLHDLRHSFASFGLSAGVSARTMQKLMGHSDVSITLGIYSHLTEGMEEDAIETIAAQAAGGGAQ
jgi:integrase